LSALGGDAHGTLAGRLRQPDGGAAGRCIVGRGARSAVALRAPGSSSLVPTSRGTKKPSALSTCNTQRRRPAGIDNQIINGTKFIFKIVAHRIFEFADFKIDPRQCIKHSLFLINYKPTNLHSYTAKSTAAKVPVPCT
jgi:hypothetical protein